MRTHVARNAQGRNALWAGLAAIMLALGAAPASAAPKVVATIKPIHSLAAAVMAGVGAPVLLVEGQASVHGFALKPSGARAIAEADILIRVSEAMEPFTTKAARSMPAGATLLTLQDAPGMTLLERRLGATFERHAHGHAREHDQAGQQGHEDHDHDERTAWDGHLWLDPVNARVITDAMVAALSARDPANAAAYKANGEALKVRIATLSDELLAELQPFSGAPFIAFHDAAQYFEHHFGPEAAGSVSVSPEVPPSAKRLSEIRARIRGLGVKCVLADPQTPPALVATVIEGTGARGAVLDAEGALIEPPGPDLWLTLMRKAAATMKACLGRPG